MYIVNFVALTLFSIALLAVNLVLMAFTLVFFAAGEDIDNKLIDWLSYILFIYGGNDD